MSRYSASIPLFSGIVGTLSDFTIMASLGFPLRVLRNSVILVPPVVLYFFRCCAESAPTSCTSSYSAPRACRSIFRDDSAAEQASLIQHVAQLVLPGARCNFFKCAKIRSSTSPGRTENSSPGFDLRRTGCFKGAGRCHGNWLKSVNEARCCFVEWAE